MKGQFNKPIWAIMTSAIMLLGTFTLVMPYQEADASHERLSLQVSIVRDGTTVAFYKEIDFRGDEPDVTKYGTTLIDLNNRDLGRVLRWCGDALIGGDLMPLSIGVGNSSHQVECDGPGPDGKWKAVFTITSLLDAGGSQINDHGTTIDAQIRVT